MWLTKPMDNGQKIDSTEALRYMLISWNIIGIYPTEKYRQLYYVYGVVMSVLFAICLPTFMLVNLFFVVDMEEFVVNLSISATIAMSSVKEFAVWLFRNDLLNSRNYLKRLDERCNPNKEDRKYILKSIRLSRMFLLVFISENGFAAISFLILAVVNHRLIHDSWFPQFFENAEANYIATVMYQSMAQLFVMFQNANNDSYPLTFLLLMIAHLRALAARIEKVGKNNAKNVDQNFEDLVACISDHKNLLDYFDSVRQVISYTMFMQFMVTGFVLCLTAIRLIVFERNGEILANLVYLVAVLSEVFPCCWFASVLMQESERLTTAIYGCNWYDQDQRFRKTLIIFMQRSQINNGIVAGKLTPLNLTTFIAIIRFSFSMYTILSQIRM